MATTLTRPETGALADAGRIAALLAELRATGAAIDDKRWLSGGLAEDPDAPLDAMSSDTRPLSALDSAGAGFLTPMISFLEEPLGQLRGDPGSVASGAGEFDSAGRDATSLADEYRSSAAGETSEWSGQSATDYLKTGTELADGILSIAETSLTSAKALISAGEAVAKTVAAVTELITAAVAEIGPIITEAIAAAPATFGQSLAVAIPRCVQIAADYGGRIAAKLAELLTSGENLIKLVEAALGVLKVVKEVLSFIGEQAQGSGAGGGSPTDEPSAGKTPTGKTPTGRTAVPADKAAPAGLDDEDEETA